jgi:hypothetical protein
LRENQFNYADALTYAEEGYNLVVVAYDCVHPEVQRAAGVLINILIKLDDLKNAERYAQITLDNLQDKKNGANQNSPDMAQSLKYMANVIYRQFIIKDLKTF